MNDNDAKFEMPKRVIDPHHHFIDTPKNAFQSFLGSVAGDVTYLPEHYSKDVIKPLSDAGVELIGTVHVEALPDDGYEEAKWVQSMASAENGGEGCPYVKAIVASCDLTSSDVEEQLQKLTSLNGGGKSCPVRGIRWILDNVGPYDGGKSATHVATKRHDAEHMLDYLKSPRFERGLSLLSRHGLSFDLHCAPVQFVESAAALVAKYPDLKVCVDHMGKPMTLLGPDIGPDGVVSSNLLPDQHQLTLWRRAMKLMSDLPNVYIKLSMMGFAVPGWVRTPARTALLRSLVREVVDLFGARRCMVAWNWHVNGAVSDSDGKSDVGPSAVELCRYFAQFFEGYSEEDRERLFMGTAKEFYRLEFD